MDPRISFSNDFVDTQQAMKHENIYREAPVSSDFEFSVKNNTMRSADEIIFQGMLLPVKDNSNGQLRRTTLKDELLVDDDDYEDIFARQPKNLGWWKERLGLKKSNVLHRRGKSSDIILERVVEEGNHICVHEASLTKRENQVTLNTMCILCLPTHSKLEALTLDQFLKLELYLFFNCRNHCLKEG